MNDDTARTSLEKQPTAARPPALAAEADVRASDADRDRVADILRDALAEGRLDAQEHGDRVDAVYAAKTVGELEPLVRDLPAGRAPAAPEPGAASAGFDYSARQDSWHGAGHGHGHTPGTENLVAIFSSAGRSGRIRVPRKINAFACFGGVEIDLTRAVFEHQEVQINATAIFGGIDIKVPENVTLRQKGAGIFGGFDIKVSESPDPDAPVVLVQGTAIFGGVEAKPKRGRLIEDLRARFRKKL